MSDFFFVSAVIACLIIPYSREILSALLGKKYEPGWLALSIMFVVPVYQSIGQINSSFLFATGKTKIYRNIAVSMSLLSIPLAYLILAPPEQWGLELGAEGLSIKMLFIVLIGTNLQSLMIARKYCLKMDISYQLIVLITLLVCSYIIKLTLTGLLTLMGLKNSFLITFIISFAVYFSGVLFILFKFPQLIGISKNELNFAKRDLNLFFKKLFYQ